MEYNREEKIEDTKAIKIAKKEHQKIKELKEQLIEKGAGRSMTNIVSNIVNIYIDKYGDKKR